MVKSLEGFRPKGVSGVTNLSNGRIVLILDMKELFSLQGSMRGIPRSAVFAPAMAAA